MKIVWRDSSCSAQEIIEALATSTTWSGSTVKTLINRLVKKGALKFEKSGKSYLYFSNISEISCKKSESEGFLRRVFDGSLSPMLAQFVDTKKLTQSELAELERLLEKGQNAPLD